MKQPGPENEPTEKPPLYIDAVAAGFPFEARDDVDRSLDLNELCVRHPDNTYFVRAMGSSMEGAGIYNGDILVVDRLLEVFNGDIVVASVDGAFTVKRFDVSQGRVRLLPENPAFDPIEFKEGETCQLFGVVSSVVHFIRKHL